MLQISLGLRIPVGSNCSYNGQKMESFLKFISSIIENPCLNFCSYIEGNVHLARF